MQPQKPHSSIKTRPLMNASLDSVKGRLRDTHPQSGELLRDLLLGHAVRFDEIADDVGRGFGIVHPPSIYAPVVSSIRLRKIACQHPAKPETGVAMPGKPFTFVEVLEAACRPHPELWREDETGTAVLNLAAVARHYARRGHPVTQPNLFRLTKEGQRPGDKVVEATHAVFGIPRAILRGEPLSHEMERTLGKAQLSTLLLAERIEELDRDDYREMVQLLEHLERKKEQLQRAIESSPNVRSLPKRP